MSNKNFDNNPYDRFSKQNNNNSFPKPESTIGETVILSSSTRTSNDSSTQANNSLECEPTEITHDDQSYQNYNQNDYYDPSNYNSMNYSSMQYDPYNSNGYDSNQYNPQDYSSQNYNGQNYSSMDYNSSQDYSGNQNYDHTQFVDPNYYYDMLPGDSSDYQNQDNASSWNTPGDNHPKKEPINKGLFIGVIIGFVSIIVCLVVIILVLHNSSKPENGLPSSVENQSTESAVESIQESVTEPTTETATEPATESYEIESSIPTEESIPSEDSIIYLYDESNTCLCLFQDSTFIWVNDINDSSTYTYGSYVLYLGEDAKQVMLTDYSSYGYTADDMDGLLASYNTNDTVCDIMLLIVHNELSMENDTDTGASAYDTILFGITDGSFFNCINCDSGSEYYFLIK